MPKLEISYISLLNIISDAGSRYPRFFAASLATDMLNDTNSERNYRVSYKNCSTHIHRTNSRDKYGCSFQYKNHCSNDWRVFDINLRLRIFWRRWIHFNFHHVLPFAIHQIKKPTVIFDTFDIMN